MVTSNLAELGEPGSADYNVFVLASIPITHMASVTAANPEVNGDKSIRLTLTAGTFLCNGLSVLLLMAK